MSSIELYEAQCRPDNSNPRTLSNFTVTLSFTRRSDSTIEQLIEVRYLPNSYSRRVSLFLQLYGYGYEEAFLLATMSLDCGQRGQTNGRWILSESHE